MACVCYDEDHTNCAVIGPDTDRIIRELEGQWEWNRMVGHQLAPLHQSPMRCGRYENSQDCNKPWAILQMRRWKGDFLIRNSGSHDSSTKLHPLHHAQETASPFPTSKTTVRSQSHMEHSILNQAWEIKNTWQVHCMYMAKIQYFLKAFIMSQDSSMYL